METQETPPGWWLASDGNWYPPQQEPFLPPPPYPPYPQPRQNDRGDPPIVAWILRHKVIGAILGGVFAFTTIGVAIAAGVNAKASSSVPACAKSQAAAQACGSYDGITVAAWANESSQGQRNMAMILLAQDGFSPCSKNVRGLMNDLRSNDEDAPWNGVVAVAANYTSNYVDQCAAPAPSTPAPTPTTTAGPTPTPSPAPTPTATPSTVAPAPAAPTPAPATPTVIPTSDPSTVAATAPALNVGLGTDPYGGGTPPADNGGCDVTGLQRAIAADTGDFGGNKIILTKFGCVDAGSGGSCAKADYPGGSIYFFDSSGIGGPNNWTWSVVQIIGQGRPVATAASTGFPVDVLDQLNAAI
jgi:hypothetical protein